MSKSKANLFCYETSEPIKFAVLIKPDYTKLERRICTHGGCVSDVTVANFILVSSISVDPKSEELQMVKGFRRPIVSIEWISNCVASGKMVSWYPYEISSSADRNHGADGARDMMELAWELARLNLSVDDNQYDFLFELLHKRCPHKSKKFFSNLHLTSAHIINSFAEKMKISIAKAYEVQHKDFITSSFYRNLNRASTPMSVTPTKRRSKSLGPDEGEKRLKKARLSTPEPPIRKQGGRVSKKDVMVEHIIEMLRRFSNRMDADEPPYGISNDWFWESLVEDEENFYEKAMSYSPKSWKNAYYFRRQHIHHQMGWFKE